MVHACVPSCGEQVCLGSSREVGGYALSVSSIGPFIAQANTFVRHACGMYGCCGWQLLTMQCLPTATLAVITKIKINGGAAFSAVVACLVTAAQPPPRPAPLGQLAAAAAGTEAGSPPQH